MAEQCETHVPYDTTTEEFKKAAGLLAGITLFELEVKMDTLIGLDNVAKGCLFLEVIVLLTARLITLAGKDKHGSLEMHTALTKLTNKAVRLALDTFESVERDPRSQRMKDKETQS